MSELHDFVAIVLAAGQGTRMKSALPKVLHPVAGRPMVAWAVSTALEAGVERCVVVVGHGADDVKAHLDERFGAQVETALQAEQRGTGHAVSCAMEALGSHEGKVLILYGDCPLIESETLRHLVQAASGASQLALLTAELEGPTGYGRILRDAEGNVIAIREHRDCSPDERDVTEVNPGIYAIDAPFLREAIASLDSDNAQGELYLTDVVEAASRAGLVADVPGDMSELRGINDRFELALCEAERRRRINAALCRSGVAMEDPSSTYIDGDCVVEPDVWLGANVHLRGRTHIDGGARVDVGSVLEDVRVEKGATILPYTVASQSSIGERAQVGPFSHLRPKSELGPESKVGNFSETKKTRIGRGSKVNHLSYVGDGEIGEGVNICAGTIFCNYDGFQKHTTILEDGVFIGSDSQLVAPLTVGKGAYVASGTTVTRDVPADALAVARMRQQNKEGYAAKLRAKMKAEKEKAGDHE